MPNSYGALTSLAVSPTGKRLRIKFLSVRPVICHRGTLHKTLGSLVVPPSFRPNVAIGTLSLAVRLPLLGRARDLHPLDYAHVGRTKKGRACS